MNSENVFEMQITKIRKKARTFEERDMEDIVCQSVGETNHCACMKKTNPLAKRKSLEIADLQYSDFVSLSPQVLPEYSRMLHELCNPNGFIPNITKYVSSANALTLNISSDNEIFICDKYYSDMNKDEHALVPIKNTKSSIIVAWRKDNAKSYLKDFIKIARSIIG